jgi:hypothetical protein
MSLHHIRTNAFWVLELPPSASRVEVERAAALALDQLELGYRRARTVTTPIESIERTPQLVREAADRLRSAEGRALERELAAIAEASRDELRAVIKALPGGDGHPLEP